MKRQTKMLDMIRKKINLRSLVVLKNYVLFNNNKYTFLQ